MALPDTMKLVLGTVKVFSNLGEYVPTSGQPAGTDADFDLGNLGTGGVAWQSAKLDLGSANLDAEYKMRAYIEFNSSPTAGGTVDFYTGFSSSATAGTDNPANLAGADQVFQGYGASTAAGTEALKQLEFVGSLIVASGIDLQVADVGWFVPKDRYMMLVAVNNTSVNVAATDAIETCVAIYPVQSQIQD